MYLNLACIVSIVVQVVGDITPVLENNKHLELEDCLYVLKSRKNFISISSLNKSNYLVYFNKIVSIRKNDSFICLSPLVDNLFHITPISILYVVENYCISLKRKMSNTNQTYLWHLCLGHINLNKIQRVVKSRTLHSLVLENFQVYESYLRGKMTKRPFNTKGVKAKDCLELVHTNVCGPFNIQACGEYEYFIIFIDDYSRYGYVYPLHRKYDALNKFKEFKTKLKN